MRSGQWAPMENTWKVLQHFFSECVKCAEVLVDINYEGIFAVPRIAVFWTDFECCWSAGATHPAWGPLHRVLRLQDISKNSSSSGNTQSTLWRGVVCGVGGGWLTHLISSFNHVSPLKDVFAGPEVKGVCGVCYRSKGSWEAAQPIKTCKTAILLLSNSLLSHTHKHRNQRKKKSCNKASVNIPVCLIHLLHPSAWHFFFSLNTPALRGSVLIHIGVLSSHVNT